ncbi:MAG: hypothetical protein AAF696_04220 [Bacteroidota bacterium]
MYIITRISTEVDLIDGIRDMDEFIYCNQQEEILFFPSRSEAKKFLKEKNSLGSILKIKIAQDRF